MMYALVLTMMLGADHSGGPTVAPAVLNHGYRTTQHERWCMMCLGQHLRNFHGQDYRALGELGYQNWVKYHETLHDEGVFKAPAKKPAAPTYRAPTRRRWFFRRRR